MTSKMGKYVAYRAAVELIEYEETHNKRKSTLSGEELFKLLHDRYQRIQQVLLPLKEKLGEEVEITNISFAEGFQDDISIIVEYIDGDKKNYFTISHLVPDNIENYFNVESKGLEKILIDNKSLLLSTFNEGYSHSYDEEIHLPTTSKRFIIHDDSDVFTIKDSLGDHVLDLNRSHLSYEKDKKLCDYRKSQYKTISRLLQNDDNVVKVFNNVRVYEEQVPKALIKK